MCRYSSQRIILPRRHKFTKPTNPLKKISCFLSKIFYSKESYTSLANLCLLGRIILWLAYGQMFLYLSGSKHKIFLIYCAQIFMPTALRIGKVTNLETGDKIFVLNICIINNCLFHTSQICS